MTRKIVFILLAILILALPTNVHAAKSYTARSYNVDLEVQRGGVMHVSETIVFRFSGGPFTYVFRTIETNFVDGIDNIHAYIDGQELAPGTDPGRVEIVRENPVRITWHFSELSDSTHTFRLTYTVRGAVRREGGTDLLEWNALPTEYDYPIESARVRVSYPPDVPLAADPSVLRGAASIQKASNMFIFQANGIDPNQPLTVALTFPRGSLIAYPPDWQRRSLLTANTVNQMMPFNLIAGFSILFLGVTGFVFWRLQANRGRRTLPAVDGPIDAPPDDLPPAMAGALVSRDDQVTWVNALGTLFDLSARGWVQIEELPGRRFLGHSFVVQFAGDADSLASRTDNLRPHERALLEMLFETRQGRREVVSLPDLRKIVSRDFNIYSESLKQELEINGLTGPNRRRNRSRMILVGLVLVFLGVIGGLLSLVFTNAASAREAWIAFRWMLLWFSSSVAMFLVGLVGLMIGTAFSPLTSRGEREGDRWRSFKRYLRLVTRGREPLAGSGPDQFYAYLPYAASFGMPEAWANFFRKKGLAEPPAWFRPLAGMPAGREMAAFVTVIAASSSIGTTTGGGAGAAGAGGGGASGTG